MRKKFDLLGQNYEILSKSYLTLSHNVDLSIFYETLGPNNDIQSDNSDFISHKIYTCYYNLEQLVVSQRFDLKVKIWTQNVQLVRKKYSNYHSQLFT